MDREHSLSVTAGAVRVATFSPAHADAVVALVLSIQRDELGLDVTLADQPDLGRIGAVYQRGRGNFWVALDGDAVVGSVGLLDFGDAGLALRKMFVDARHRGAGGVGARLLHTALDHAAGAGADEIYLGTIDRMTAAARFYRKHGFGAIDEGALPSSFPRVAVDNRFYRYSFRRPTPRLPLTPLADRLAICRLPPDAPPPAWATRGAFSSLTRTPAELSIVCRAADVPEAVEANRDWRGLAVRGPLDFSIVGVLAALTAPLARRGLSVFALSSFDTDYLLVRAPDFEAACRVLRAAGHEIAAPPEPGAANTLPSA